MFTSVLSERCESVSTLLKLISNPIRLKLLCAMTEGRKNVGELEGALSLSQSLVSQHVLALWRGGVLGRSKEGQSVYYSIKDQRVLALMQRLYELFCKGEDQ